MADSYITQKFNFSYHPKSSFRIACVEMDCELAIIDGKNHLTINLTAQALDMFTEEHTKQVKILLEPDWSPQTTQQVIYEAEVSLLNDVIIEDIKDIISKTYKVDEILVECPSCYVRIINVRDKRDNNLDNFNSLTLTQGRTKKSGFNPKDKYHYFIDEFIIN